MSAEAVKRIGVGNLEAMHRSALRGYAQGGAVGSIASSPSASNTKQNVHVTVGVDPKTGNLTAFVDERASKVTRAGLHHQERTMNSRIQQFNNDPLRR